LKSGGTYAASLTLRTTVAALSLMSRPSSKEVGEY
jgi:hypothetical protein